MSEPIISEEDLDLAEEEMLYVSRSNSCRAPAPGNWSPGQYQARRCHRASGHTGAHVSGLRRRNDSLVWPGDDEPEKPEHPTWCAQDHAPGEHSHLTQAERDMGLDGK